VPNTEFSLFLPFRVHSSLDFLGEKREKQWAQTVVASCGRGGIALFACLLADLL